METSLQTLAAAMTSLASTQSTLASAQVVLSYTLIVLTVGTIGCLALLARVTIEVHRQTNELLRRRTP